MLSSRVSWKQGTLKEKSERGDGWGGGGRKKFENLSLIMYS